MSDPVIRAQDLSKAYRLGLREARPDTLVGAASRWVRAPWRNWQNLRRLDTSRAGRDEGAVLWALRGVSFEVAQGEVVGIIGRNGAGKSTLLKLLSRITEPTSGRAVIRGRVSSLLEVGTGFHPELTGRENIYMNGTILGMTKREIDRKFDEIVAFSGAERFLDTPIKRYSSGMTVRLAFSVAAHLEPEVLIIDEVLAVGDQEFQRKCTGKMQDVALSGRTVLFVSHNMAAVESLCSRAVLLRDGTVECHGDTETVISRYLSGLAGSLADAPEDADLRSHRNRRAGSERVLARLVTRTPSGLPVSSIRIGDPVQFRIGFSMDMREPGLCFAVFLCSHGKRQVMFHTSVNSQLRIPRCGQGVVTCDVPEVPLVPGEYTIDVAAGTGTRLLDYIERASVLHVTAADYLSTGQLPTSSQAVVAVPARWSFEAATSDSEVLAAS